MFVQLGGMRILIMLVYAKFWNNTKLAIAVCNQCFLLDLQFDGRPSLKHATRAVRYRYGLQMGKVFYGHFPPDIASYYRCYVDPGSETQTVK